MRQRIGTSRLKRWNLTTLRTHPLWVFFSRTYFSDFLVPFCTPHANVLMGLEFLWFQGFLSVWECCENCPSKSRKRKYIIPPSVVTPRIQAGKSLLHPLLVESYFFPPEFAKICWLPQSIRVLVAGMRPKLCHVGEGRRPSLNSVSQPPEQIVVFLPLMSQCSNYIWLFPGIFRALTRLGHQPTWHQRS